MKDLNQYVEELLYKHQCVIIPKLGAFISNRKSARLFEDKTFAPPKRELTFNASLNSNDGLLMKHIANASGVEYAKVEDYVNTAVEGWKRVLQQGEALTLPNIGTLRQTPEGRISFEAFEDVNYLTDSFGMSSFVAHEVKDPSSATKAAENPFSPPKAPAATPQKEQVVENNAPQKAEPEAPKAAAPAKAPKVKAPKGDKKTKSRSFLKYTAVAVIGLGILAVGAIKFFGEPVENQVNTENMLVIDESQVEEKIQQKLSEATFFQVPVKLSSIALDIKKVKKLSVERTSTTVKEEPKKDVSVPKEITIAKENKKEKATERVEKTTSTASFSSNKKYHVIAGAFKDEKNANARVSKLKSLGFPNASVIGINAKGLYQVSYAGFDNKTEAEALQKEVRAAKESKKLDGGWIFTNQ